MSELQGKSALVTGGNSGIGRASAVALADLGARVIITGRDEARGNATVQKIRANGGKADFLRSDLRDLASVRALAVRARELAGQVDILVNNAGIYPFVSTDETSEQDFDSVYTLNVKVPYFLVAELAPEMAARGHGAIINLTTMVSEFGAAGYALYGSSKAAVVLLTKAWAAEYGPKGVRVNAVSPGPTRTEGTSGFTEDLEALAGLAPAGRPGSAEEIAEAVAFLATDRASFVYGALLPVDGGRIAV